MPKAATLRSLYNGALYGATLVGAVPLFFWRSFTRPRYREALPERLGHLTDESRPEHPPLWLHGVSLGEIRALAPIVTRWRRAFPDRPLLISASTETGLDAARSLYGKIALITAFPFDLQGAVTAHLDYWQPAVVGILETELWPNFFWTCCDRGIPLCVLSGRVSERTFRRMSGWLKPFSQSFLQCANAFAMQSPWDAERIVAMGAPPDRVSVLGNIKWDNTAPPDAEAVAAWRVTTHISPDTPLVLWGSTHEGEEQLALESWLALREEDPSVRLCIAPRHPRRFETVARAMTQAGVRVARRSENGRAADWDVLVLDTLGELSTAYGAASVAVMGGTFTNIGGHNILEPLAAAVPTILGPHIQSIRDLAGVALQAGAVVQIESSELVPTLQRLLQDGEEREALARCGAQLLQSHRGTADRLLELLAQLWPAS